MNIAIYDRNERLWRAEDAAGRIVGYYQSEAAALVAGGAEQPPVAAPSRAYQRIAALLQDMERMPTGTDLYALLVEEPIMPWVWWRIVDWTLYQLARGVPVQRHADDDQFSEQYEAARAAALARLHARGIWYAKLTDRDFDTLVSVHGAHNENGLAEVPADPIGDAYRAGYQAGYQLGERHGAAGAAREAIALIREVRQRHEQQSDEKPVTLERGQYVATRPLDSSSMPFLDARCGDCRLILDNPERLSSENPLDDGCSSLALLINNSVELTIDGAILRDLRQLLNSAEVAQLVAIDEGGPIPPEIAALPTVKHPI